MKQPDSRKKFHRGTLPRFAGLMQNCREQVAKNFAGLLSQMLDGVSEDLVKRMERAVNSSLINSYEHARMELQLRRVDVEQAFFQGVLENFRRFDKGVYTEEVGEAKAGAASDEPFSLVDKDAYEVDMAITNIVTGVCFECSMELYELNQRLAMVNGGTPLGERSQSFPGGPAVLCHQFVHAIRTLGMDLESELVLLDLFDIRVMRKVGPVYADFNQMLKRAGVLAALRPAVRNEGSSLGSPQSASAGNQGRAASSGQTISAPGSHDEDMHQQLFRGITDILAGLRLGNGEVTPVSPVQGSGSGVSLAGPGSHPEGLRDVAGVPALEQARKVLAQHRQHYASVIQQPGMTHMQDVVDLVGLLFEYILDDRQLPDSIKAVLSYLHTPILKVALLDQKLFTSETHAARRLLNELSLLGVRYSPNDRNTFPVLAKIQAVVTRIVREYRDDIQLFQEMLDEVRVFREELEKRASMQETRAVQAAQGQGRLHDARRTVYRTLMSCIARRPLPDDVDEMLMGPWASYLVLLLLRTGQESPQWQVALRTTEGIISSVQPQESVEAGKQRLAQWPALLEDVRRGLDMAGDLNLDVNDVMKRLQACQKEALLAHAPHAHRTVTGTYHHDSRPISKTESRAGQENKTSRLQQLRDIIPREWLENSTSSAAGQKPKPMKKPPTAEELALKKRIRNLPYGTWFEFVGEDAQRTERVKLAWVNTTTMNFMFVNQGGRQIAIKPLDQLADEITSGKVRILEDEKMPLMDRALRSIHHILKKKSDNDTSQ